jgi:hypothetical protein
MPSVQGISPFDRSLSIATVALDTATGQQETIAALIRKIPVAAMRPRLLVHFKPRPT